ncbi:MAG: hypothetical protein IT303_10300 [Dehalococcoidia bacterium]|nr:hypothetical protein [Dehalococcoidia bacterium]
MAYEARVPGSVSVYEALRVRPAAGPRLARMGVTRELYDYRIADAATLLGVPVERLTAVIEGEPALH